ncbi:MAG: aldo/keto reductase [Bacteroidota bacterium]|nr:aldo/keto reductase [Bacteroidota bacterium]MDP4216518.1 aldo/keto reductase [Bacteroidota bacterium]MDP4247058.1 aldo/keto reductase [Bacteroidota bacterium]MDP4254031.1 aldo/keto reductase [Bacteroidota bacterium]MDP4257439.1 aldo/keto reductase [Bacteroidota bacterium]
MIDLVGSNQIVNKVKNVTILGSSTLQVNRIGLGCMGMSEFYGSFNEEESVSTLHKAIDIGVNFFDTADMYGWGANEKLIGKAFRRRWDKVILATKFGVMRGSNGEWLGLNGKPEYIKKACEQSLSNLGTEAIDLYYMHRQDPHVEIEEIVDTLSNLVKQGKVKYIGLCEVDADTIRRAHKVHPITALQTEYSLWSREPEKELFGVCKELGITFVSYSPLGRGFLTGAIRSRADMEAGDFRLSNPRFTDAAIAENLTFVNVLDQLAKDKGVTKAQIALSWILSQNHEITAIPGTRKIHRLEENLGALNVELTEADFDIIESAMPKITIGSRY